MIHEKSGLGRGPRPLPESVGMGSTGQMTTAVPLTATMSMEPLSPMVS